MSMHQSINKDDEVYGVTDLIWAPKFIADEDIAFLKSPIIHSPSKISAVDVPAENVSSESVSNQFFVQVRIDCWVLRKASETT